MIELRNKREKKLDIPIKKIVFIFLSRNILAFLLMSNLNELKYFRLYPSHLDGYNRDIQ